MAIPAADWAEAVLDMPSPPPALAPASPSPSHGAAPATPCTLALHSAFNLPPLLDASTMLHSSADCSSTAAAAADPAKLPLALGLGGSGDNDGEDLAAVVRGLCAATRADHVGPVAAEALCTPQPLCSASVSNASAAASSLLHQRWEDVLSTDDFSGHLGGLYGTAAEAGAAVAMVDHHHHSASANDASSGYQLDTPCLTDLDHFDLFDAPEDDDNALLFPADTSGLQTVPAPAAYDVSVSSADMDALLATPQPVAPKAKRRAAAAVAPAAPLADTDTDADASDAGAVVAKKAKKQQRRRKKQAVPDEKKDAAYWEYRRKNNERAKRSREKKKREQQREQERLKRLASEGGRLRDELDQLHDAYASLSAAVASRMTDEYGAGADAGAASAAVPDAIRLQLAKVQAALSRAETLRAERQTAAV